MDEPFRFSQPGMQQHHGALLIVEIIIGRAQKAHGQMRLGRVTVEHISEQVPQGLPKVQESTDIQ